jgi:hypothetical protein
MGPGVITDHARPFLTSIDVNVSRIILKDADRQCVWNRASRSLHPYN